MSNLDPQSRAVRSSQLRQERIVSCPQKRNLEAGRLLGSLTPVLRSEDSQRRARERRGTEAKGSERKGPPGPLT